MAWYGHLIVWCVFFAAGFGLGALYKAHKISPIVATIKDPNLSAEDKIKKILDIL